MIEGINKQHIQWILPLVFFLSVTSADARPGRAAPGSSSPGTTLMGPGTPPSLQEGHLQQWRDKESKSPHFIENNGQITDQHGKPRKDIDFLHSANGVRVYIGSGRVHYQWTRGVGRQVQEPVADDIYRMDISLVGADKNAQVVTDGIQPYYERYFKQGLNGVTAHAYRKVTYREVYRNIDWVFYFNEHGMLEYDFVVRPGGKVSDIKIRYGGASGLHLNADGSLTAKTPAGTVTEHAPYSYDSEGSVIASRFVVRNNELSFRAGAYKGTLTIDPVVEWATYYGGEASDNGRDVVTDPQGNVYLLGHTKSTLHIASSGGYDNSINGDYDLFLVKFDSAGVRQWATYYGGAQLEYATSATCDTMGNVYICGYTRSPGLGTQGVHQDTLTPGSNFDAFVAKFDQTGNRIWHSYYGGTGSDEASAVACDPQGNVYLAGTTQSAAGIATSNGYRIGISGGRDAFLVKFDSSGHREWGTYFGGTSDDYGYGLTCDAAGFVYLCGRTASVSDIASPGSHLDTYQGWMFSGFNVGYVAYLVKFDGAGRHQWGTYYAGGMSDGLSVACDPYYNVYMAGRAVSDSLYVATPGSHQDKAGSLQDGDAYLVKFDSSGVRSWGTYYGGIRDESYIAVACNSRYVYIAGQTTSPDQIAGPGAQFGQYNDSCTLAGCVPDLFFVKFDTAGTRLWSTYYGTKTFDQSGQIACDDYGSFYISGSTKSLGLATPGSHQDTIYGVGSDFDALLLKFYDCPPSPSVPALVSGNDTLCMNSTEVYSVPDSAGISYLWELPAGWNGTTAGDTVTLTAPGVPGSATIKVSAYLMCEKRVLQSAAQVLDLYVLPFDPVNITVNGFVLGTSARYATWQWLLAGDTIPNARDSTYTVTANGNYSVAVTDANGCRDTSGIYPITNVGISEAPVAGDQVRIYPNPARDIVYISASVPVSVSVTGLDGKMIVHRDGAKEVDISALSPGIYLVAVTGSDGRLLRMEKLVRMQ